MFDLQSAMDAMNETAGAVKKIGSVVEKVFGPQWQKKKADAEAYAINTIAETIRKNTDMKITYDAGVVFIEKKEFDRLLDDAINREAGEKVKQQQNLEAVLTHMLEELKKVKNISDEPVDEDFVDRLVENAKRANKKEMQFIWGKILAQEVVQPGSFSLRTLEVVRNLNKLEEKVFHKVATVTLKSGSQYFLPAKLDLTTKYGVDFTSLLILQECGLLQSFEALPLNINLGVGGIVGLENNENIIVIKRNSSSKSLFSVDAYKFTKAGQELLGVLTPSSEMRYAFEYGKFLQTSNPDLNVNAYEVIDKKENGEIVFSDKPINFD